jgi:hypothetical protein
MLDEKEPSGDAGASCAHVAHRRHSPVLAAAAPARGAAALAGRHARRHALGEQQLLLFSTTACTAGPTRTSPQVIDQLAAEYVEDVKAGRANSMHVVLAGPAFAASIARRRELSLYAP